MRDAVGAATAGPGKAVRAGSGARALVGDLNTGPGPDFGPVQMWLVWTFGE